MVRKYEKGKRAVQEGATRQRIVEAAVELHEAIGGEATTVTAVADRAGVGRVTFYRHFPDERSLLSACTGHYLDLNPPPDPTPWPAISDPIVRFRTALRELYAFYGRTEGMLARAEQESPTNPILAELMQPLLDYRCNIQEMLVQGWSRKHSTDPVVRAAIGHALAFATWRSLVRQQGLEVDKAIALMLKLTADADESD